MSASMVRGLVSKRSQLDIAREILDGIRKKLDNEHESLAAVLSKATQPKPLTTAVKPTPQVVAPPADLREQIAVRRLRIEVEAEVNGDVKLGEFRIWELGSD